MSAITIELFNLIIGAGLLMLANILLGSINAVFESEFDWNIFFKGFARGVLVIISILGICFAGFLNPDIISINLGEETVSIVSAINILLLATCTIYFKQVFEKLSAILLPSDGEDVVADIIADAVASVDIDKEIDLDEIKEEAEKVAEEASQTISQVVATLPLNAAIQTVNTVETK